MIAEKYEKGGIINEPAKIGKQYDRKGTIDARKKNGYRGENNKNTRKESEKALLAYD